MDKLRPFLPALTLAGLCLILPGLLGEEYLPGEGHACARTLFLYQFTHASVFHLAANVIALLYFRPRWSTCLVAFLAAALGAYLYLLLPTTHALPSCGMSGLVCAAFARRYASHRSDVLPFILLQLPFIFLPNFNYVIHILSFFIAYSTWMIYYARKTGL